MSDIQRENGHIDIANKLIESLMKTHLSGREWQIMMVIFRQTWGYCDLKDGKQYKDKSGMLAKKKMDRISHSQFEDFTGINRRKIWGILNNLLSKNMIIKTITKKGDITVCNYGIQKDSSKWILSPKKGIKENPSNRRININIKEIKNNIRKRDNNTCCLCGYNGNLTKETLPVHHIDLNEGNNEENNLITLCRSCHTKSNVDNSEYQQMLKDTITKKGDYHQKETKTITNFGTKVSPKKGHTKETITKETIQKKLLSHTYKKCEVVYQLTIYLEGKIIENNKSIQKRTESQLQSWCKDIDKLLRLDKANPTEVKQVIDWVVEDDFWSANVLSAAKLRKHYPRFYKRVIDRGKSLSESIESRFNDLDDLDENKNIFGEEELN